LSKIEINKGSEKAMSKGLTKMQKQDN
jgi:hypothetical protein